MIVRILGEGQYRLSDADVPDVDAIDDRLTAAIEQGHQAGFEADFAELVAYVRAHGEPTPADHLGASDLVLPPADAGFEEVRGMLRSDGLVQG
jgi:hypothetical protein